MSAVLKTDMSCYVMLQKIIHLITVCVLQFEGIPVHPHVGRFWEVIEKYRVTKFYTAPTAIRLLMKYGKEPLQK